MFPAIAATYLTSFGNATVSAIKDTNGLHITLPELRDYAVPPKDVPMRMRHRCKVKALGYEGAIAISVNVESE